jgi:phosphoribosyl 1,2-cyclic phosphodiesterase
MARFCSLSSSSSGNCAYVGSAEGGILIDAGVSARQISMKLDCIGVNPVDIGAIFVTHEHSDHVRGLRVFASKNNIPVYATQGTVNALESGGIANGSFEVNVIENGGLEINGQFIKPFRTSHDSAESCGFIVTTSDERKIAFATDTGIITPETRDAVTGCDLILAESNHDIGMLRNGSYPYMLKRRILSEKGHLSNIDCSNFVTELVQSGTTRIVLGHLSKENNIPELAYQTTKSALDCIGAVQFKDYILKVADSDNIETVVL